VFARGKCRNCSHAHPQICNSFIFIEFPFGAPLADIASGIKREEIEMKKNLGVLAAVAVFGFSLLVFGQQGRGMQQGAGSYQAAIDSVILQGVVVNVAPDSEHGTSLVLQLQDKSKVTVMLGLNFGTQSGLSFTNGQKLTVKAYPSPQLAGTYRALEITDVATGTVLKLRTGGMGQHMGGGAGMMGHGMGYGRMGAGQGQGACQIDPATAVTLDGVVTDTNIGLGMGHPTFTVAQNGKELKVMAGPVWALEGLKLKNGDVVSVKAFVCAADSGYYVAAEIVNATNNASVKLRDEKGMPVFGPNANRP
jgi:hypothetical protein